MKSSCGNVGMAGWCLSHTFMMGSNKDHWIQIIEPAHTGVLNNMEFLYIPYLAHFLFLISQLFAQNHELLCPDPHALLMVLVACGSIVVKALYYKPEGRGFDTR
jgi:uncharacterized circularly permuted ATP-grasp superfamily protein